MAEITYTGRGSRGGPSGGQQQQQQQQQLQHQQQTPQRPSTASPRLQGNPNGQGNAAASPGSGYPSARRMLAFLDSAAAKAGNQPAMFPASETLPSGIPGHAGHHRPATSGSGRQQDQHGQQSHLQRPRSAAPLRTSGGPRIREHTHNFPSPPSPPPRQYGRASLYDHAAGEREPHAVPGPVVLRDLQPARVGFPARPPEEFLRSGEGLTLAQRRQLREHLQRFPVNTEAPFVPGSGGVVLPPRRPPNRPPGPTTRTPLPASLLRTYYDNGTLDFVAVRWRGARADALVWARGVSKGPEAGGPHAARYTSWAPEPPAELDPAAWLPVFLDGVREYDEPYRFLAIRGSEELLLSAGDTIHTFAESLVSPLKAALDTREPTTVAVALQLMCAALSIDPRVAPAWVPAYWQFSQVLNLFHARGGGMRVDMGYNRRAVATCRQLATDFMLAFEMAGGPAATAAVRRYSPGTDPAVTDASMARAAKKAAAKAAEAGLEPGTFKPFTLF